MCFSCAAKNSGISVLSRCIWIIIRALGIRLNNELQWNSHIKLFPCHDQAPRVRVLQPSLRQSQRYADAHQIHSHQQEGSQVHVLWEGVRHEVRKSINQPGPVVHVFLETSCSALPRVFQTLVFKIVSNLRFFLTHVFRISSHPRVLPLCRSSLRDHIDAIHLNIRKFSCDACSQTFR